MLLTVKETAFLLKVVEKTVRRMLQRGELVAHRVGHNVRVDAESVTRLLTGSRTTSGPVVDAKMKNDEEKNSDGARLYRQRGRSRIWTALVGNNELALGTADRRKAEQRLARIVSTPAGRAKADWRVYRDKKGWFIKYYEGNKRRTQRIPPAAGVETQDQAEEYARRWHAGRCADEEGLPVLDPAAVVLKPDMTFQQFGELWTGGRLAELFPDYVERKASSKDDKARLEAYVYPVIGTQPLSAFNGDDAVGLVDPIKVELAKTQLAASTRRQVLQAVNRLFNLATYPARLLPFNPLPRGFVPKPRSTKAKTYLLPDEDARLLALEQVPLVERLLFGVLAREGMRVSEALSLTWGDVDLAHGVLHLDENKTDEPRAWSLDLGVLEALERWKKTFRRNQLANARVFVATDGGPLDRFGLAGRLRDGLKAAGVSRPQLFESSDKRIPLRVHDLRATFVTISLALGKTEAWVTDRTGHRSSQMIYTYKRQARTYAELNLGPLKPLHLAIPELA